MIAGLLRAVLAFPFKIGGYNINVSWYKGTRGDGGCGNGHRRRLTREAEGSHGIRIGRSAGEGGLLGRGQGGQRATLGWGDLYGGLLAISHLNNSFVYSKLNEHNIIDINSLSL